MCSSFIAAADPRLRYRGVQTPSVVVATIHSRRMPFCSFAHITGKEFANLFCANWHITREEVARGCVRMRTEPAKKDSHSALMVRVRCRFPTTMLCALAHITGTRCALRCRLQFGFQFSCSSKRPAPRSTAIRRISGASCCWCCGGMTAMARNAGRSPRVHDPLPLS